MKQKRTQSHSLSFVLFVFLLTLFSCAKSDDANGPEETQDPLIGIWKTHYVRLVQFEGDEIISDDSEYIGDTEYSTLEFKEDGTVIEIDYYNSAVSEVEEVPYETVSDTLYIYWENGETENSKYSITNDELHLLAIDEIESNEEYYEVYKRQ